jgi:chaperonin GroES
MPKNNKKTKKVMAKKPIAKKAITMLANKFKIRPLQDRIVIKEDTAANEKMTATGIIIPASASEDKGGKRGEVVAIGPGRIEDGKTIAPAVKVGDKVVFQWGDKIKVDDEEYYIVRESEILAVIK